MSQQQISNHDPSRIITKDSIKHGKRIIVVHGEYCVGKKGTMWYYQASPHGSHGGLFIMDERPDWLDDDDDMIWLPFDDVKLVTG